MVKIIVYSEDKDKVRSIIVNDPFLGSFELTEDEDGFGLDGMKYCTILNDPNYGSFKLVGQTDKPLADVIADALKEVPGIEVKGSLLLGNDNYRHFYWIYSESGKKEVTVDYAIDINETSAAANKENIGKPLSSAWYYSLYDTSYGTEYLVFETIEDLRGAVNMAAAGYDIDEENKKLGLNLLDIYKFISDIMDIPAGDLEDVVEICEEIKEKYNKEYTNEDRISKIINDNLVPMASEISYMSIYEVWAYTVKKKMSKSKFFKLFQIEEELEDLETDDYVELLSQIAEDYEGFSEMECDDFIDLCDGYGITSGIDEDDFDEVKEKLENMGISEIDEDYV